MIAGDLLKMFTILSAIRRMPYGREREKVSTGRRAATKPHRISEAIYGGQNDTQAVRWYWKAAEQGYATAEIALGECLLSGYGIKKDLRGAVSWYQKAVDQGDGLAQYKLDVLPDEDKMVEKPEEVRDEKI